MIGYISVTFLFYILNLQGRRPGALPVIRFFLLKLWMIGTLQILTSSLNPVLYSVVWSVFVLIEVLNFEHVKINNTHSSMTFLKMALHPVFLKGSLTSKRLIIRIISSLIVAFGLNLFLNPALKPPFIWLAGLITFFIWKPEQEWYSTSWEEVWLTKTDFRRLEKPKAGGWKKEAVEIYNFFYQENIGRDLSAEKISFKEKKNVLLIVVEGICGKYLRDGTMPLLTELAKKNLFCDRFICPQKNTNNGLYSVLTGESPNISKNYAKSDLVAQYGMLIDSLPDFFRRLGHHTIFLQSAPLTFMSKDRFAAQIGFHEVLGGEHFDQFKKGKWGLADEDLYKAAFEKFKTTTSPLFMTLLTSSTHHPYFVPGKGEVTRKEAFHYADRCLSDFINQLSNAAILEDTHVVITTDESSYVGDNNVLSNWGTCIVLTNESRRNESFFSLSDIPITIADMMNQTEGHKFTGRSLLRNYENEREFFFGNNFVGSVYHLKNNVLRLLKGNGWLCSKFSDFEDKLTFESSNESTEHFQKFVQLNDLDLNFIDSGSLVDLENKILSTKGNIEVFSAIRAYLMKGQLVKIRLKGKLEAASKTPAIMTFVAQDMIEKKSHRVPVYVSWNEPFDQEVTFRIPSTSSYNLNLMLMNEGQLSLEYINMSIES